MANVTRSRPRSSGRQNRVNNHHSEYAMTGQQFVVEAAINKTPEAVWNDGNVDKPGKLFGSAGMHSDTAIPNTALIHARCMAEIGVGLQIFQPTSNRCFCRHKGTDQHTRHSSNEIGV